MNKILLLISVFTYYISVSQPIYNIYNIRYYGTSQAIVFVGDSVNAWKIFSRDTISGDSTGIFISKDNDKTYLVTYHNNDSSGFVTKGDSAQWFYGGIFQTLPNGFGSNGQLMATDGAGHLYYTSAGASPYSIKGRPDAVLFFNQDSTLNWYNGGLYYDTSLTGASGAPGELTANNFHALGYRIGSPSFHTDLTTSATGARNIQFPQLQALDDQVFTSVNGFSGTTTWAFPTLKVVMDTIDNFSSDTILLVKNKCNIIYSPNPASTVTFIFPSGSLNDEIFVISPNVIFNSIAAGFGVSGMNQRRMDAINLNTEVHFKHNGVGWN